MRFILGRVSAEPESQPKSQSQNKQWFMIFILFFFFLL